MAKGGARIRSGPAANPNSIRQDAADWTVLPAAGRDGEPPEWPLTAATARERVLWAREWTRPQAVEWERLGLATEVAVYVRTLRHVEKPGPKGMNASLLGHLKQMQNSLGMTAKGMADMRWRLDDAGRTPPAEGPSPEPSDRPDNRALLELVVNQ